MNTQTIDVDYSTKIHNNVGLSEDRRVLKALESWHPGYINWWNDMGPEGFQESLVYLRTAYSVDPRGWAKFDYVKMPDYRWGILLAPQEENRVIPFGEHYGEPAWQEVPGEYRAMLRRIIVIQGDTDRIMTGVGTGGSSSIPCGGASVAGAARKLRDAGQMYISVLTDPTYGGVTASYAFLGDIILAEPKALIGFAGPRVIKETIRAELPAGFQTAEFLLDRGLIDSIVPRKEMKPRLIEYLNYMPVGQN